MYIYIYKNVGEAACTSTDAKESYVSSTYAIQTLTGMTKDACVEACCSNTNCYAVLIYRSSGTCYLRSTFPSGAVSSSSSYYLYYLVRDSVSNYLDVRKYGNSDCSSSVTTYWSYAIDSCVPYLELVYTEHAYHLYELESSTSLSDFTVRHLVWFEAPGCTAPENEWTTPDINETQGSSNCYDYYRNYEVGSTPRDIPVTSVTTEDNYQPQYVIWRKYANTCDEGPPSRVSYSVGQCHEEETLRDSFKFESTGTHPAEGYQMEVSWWDSSTTCAGSPSSQFNITWGCRTNNPGSGYFTFSSTSLSSTCSATTTTGVSQSVSTSYSITSYSYTNWDSCFSSCCSRSDCYAFMLSSSRCYILRQFSSGATASSTTYTLYYMVRDGKSKPGAFLDTRVYNSEGCGGSVTDYISYPIESCIPYKYLAYHSNAYQMFQVDSYTSTRSFVLRHLVWFEAPGCTAPESDWDTPDINTTRNSNSCYKNYTFYELKHAPRDVPITAVSTQDNYEPQYVIWRKYADTCSGGPPKRVSYSVGQCHEEETLRDSFKFESTGTHPAEGYQMEVSWWDSSTTCGGSPSSQFNITWGCRTNNPGSGYFTFSSTSLSSTCSATTTTGVSQSVSTSYSITSYSYTNWDSCFSSCCSRSDCYAFMLSSSRCYILRQFSSGVTASSTTYTLYYIVRDAKSKPGAFLDTRVYNSEGCGGSVTDYISYPIESCVPYKYLVYHSNAYQMFQVDSYTSTRSFVLRHLVWFEAPGCTAPESDWDTPDINTTRNSDSCYKNYTFYELKHAPRDVPIMAVLTQDNYEPQYVIWRKYADTCSGGPPKRVSYSVGQCHEEETLRDSFKFESTETHPAEGYQMEVSWWDSSTTCGGSPSSQFNITWGCRTNNPGSGYFTFSSTSLSSTCSATTTTGVSQSVSTSYSITSYSYTSWDSCFSSCCSRSDCYAFMLSSSRCYILRQFSSSATSSSTTYTLYYMVRDAKSKPGAFLDTRVYNSEGCGGSVTDYISYPIESCVPYKYLAYHNNAYQMFRIDSYTSTRSFVLRHLVWFEAPGCTAPESDWDTPDINTTHNSDSCYKNYTFYELKHAPRDVPITAVSTQDNYEPQYVIWRKYANTCSGGPPKRVSYSIGQCHKEETLRDSFKFESTGTHPAEGYQMEVSWWGSSTTCGGSPSSRFNITWGCRTNNPGSGYFTFSSTSLSSTCSATTTTGVSQSVSTTYSITSYSYTSWDSCFSSCCSRSDCYAFMLSSSRCYILRQFSSGVTSSSTTYTLYYMVRDAKSKPGAFLDTRVYNSEGCGGSVTDYISYPIESCVPYKYLAYHNNAYQMFQVDSYTSTRSFVLRHLVWFKAPGCTAPESDWDTPDINTTHNSDSCYKNYTFYELKHAPRDVPITAVSTQDNYEPQYVIWRKYANTCSGGPPKRVSYSIGQCHKEETLRDSFKFESTGTHPAEGYQMEVSWWGSSTTCGGSPSSRFNITWGCRTNNPGSGYFTFSSTSLSSTCSATTTTGVSQSVSTTYSITSYSYTSWDSCFSSCCSRSDCYAFMLSSSRCYILRQFSSGATSSSTTYTLYYMVRDGKSKPGAFLDTRVYNSEGCGGSVTDYISYPIESCVPYKYLAYHNNAYQMFRIDSYTSTRSFVLRHLVWFEAPGCTAPESDWDTPDINTTRNSDSCYKNYTFYELKHAPRDVPITAVSTQDNYEPQYVIWRKYGETCSGGPPKRVAYNVSQCHEEETLRDSFKFESTGTHPAEGYQMEVSWWDSSTTCAGSPSSQFNITWGCRSTYPGSGYFTFSSTGLSSTCSATTTTGVSQSVSTSTYSFRTYSYTTWDSCYSICCSWSNCHAFMLSSSRCYVLNYFLPSVPSTSTTYTLYYMVRDGKSKPGVFLDTRVYNSEGCGGSVTDYISYPIESCVPYKYLAYHEHAYQMFRVDSYTSTRSFVLRHLVWFEAPGCTAPESDWDTPDINTTRNSDSCYKNYTFYELKHAPRDIPITAVSTQDNYEPQYVIWRKYGETCSGGPPKRVAYNVSQCHEEEALRHSFKFESTGTHPAEGYQMEVSWWDSSATCAGSPSSQFNITWGCRSTNPGSGYFTFSSTGLSSTCSATTTTGVFQYVSTSTYSFRTYSYTTWDSCYSICCSWSNCHAFMLSSSRCYVLNYFSPSVPSSSTTYTLYYMVRDGKSKPGVFLDTRVYNSEGCGGSVTDYISYPIESCVPYKYLAYHEHAYQMFRVDSYTSTRSFVLRHLVWFEAPGCTAPESDWDTPDINTTRNSDSCYKNYTFYELKHAPRDIPITAVSTQDNYEPQYVIWRKYGETCSGGPPKRVAYNVSQCHEEETLRDSFKFESTETHPAEGYQMEVSWWDSSTTCAGSPSSRFNITWGCRSTYPGSGYFTFSSTGLSSTCSATTTTGVFQYVSTSTYSFRTYSYTTWDSCYSICCSWSNCHAFMLSSSRCYVLNYFSPSVPITSTTYTLYYMVRDGSATPRRYVDTRIYSSSSCSGSISSYNSLPLGYCTRYTYLEYTDHTYQMLYLDSYTDQNNYVLRHLVWYDAPGCTVDESQWDAADINTTRRSGDCFQDYNFWTVKYAPYSRNVGSVVTGADNFIPSYVNHRKYSTPCSSTVTEQVSYQLGYCYEGNGGSFTIQRTVNHPTSGYQMKVRIWSGSTICSGDPSEIFNLVWGCRVATSFSGSFTFTSSASYTVPQGFELSSSTSLMTSTMSISSFIPPPTSVMSSSSSISLSSPLLSSSTISSSMTSAVSASSTRSLSSLGSSSSVEPTLSVELSPLVETSTPIQLSSSYGSLSSYVPSSSIELSLFVEPSLSIELSSPIGMSSYAGRSSSAEVPSTTDLSSPVEPSLSVGLSSSIRTSSYAGLSSSAVVSSAIELSSPIETSLSIELSLSIGTLPYAGPLSSAEVSSTELSSPVEPSLSIDLSLPIGTLSYAGPSSSAEVSSTIELSSPVEPSLSIDLSSPIGMLSYVGRSSSAEVSSTIELSSPVESPLSVELSSPIGTSYASTSSSAKVSSTIELLSPVESPSSVVPSSSVGPSSSVALSFSAEQSSFFAPSSLGGPSLSATPSSIFVKQSSFHVPSLLVGSSSYAIPSSSKEPSLSVEPSSSIRQSSVRPSSTVEPFSTVKLSLPQTSVIQSVSTTTSSLSTTSTYPETSSAPLLTTTSSTPTSSVLPMTPSCGPIPDSTPLSQPVCPGTMATSGLNVIVLQSAQYQLKHLTGVTKEQCFTVCCSDDDCYSFTRSLTSNECWFHRKHPLTAVQSSDHHTTFYMVRDSPGPYLDTWVYSGEGCTSLPSYTSYSLDTCIPYRGLDYQEHSYQVFQLDCYTDSGFTLRHLVWYEAPGCTVPKNQWLLPNVNVSVNSSSCYGNVRFWSVKDQPRDIPVEAVTKVDSFIPTYVNYVKYSSCSSTNVISQVSYKTGVCYSEDGDSFAYEQTTSNPSSGYQMKVRWWSGTRSCSGSPSQMFDVVWGCQMTSVLTGVFSFTDSALFAIPGESISVAPTTTSTPPTYPPPSAEDQSSTIIAVGVSVPIVIIVVVVLAVVAIVAMVIFRVKKAKSVNLVDNLTDFPECKLDMFGNGGEPNTVTIRNPLNTHDADNMDTIYI